MADILTITAGGLIVGSIYLLKKALDAHNRAIDTSWSEICRLRDDIRKRRYHASVLKKKLRRSHDVAFDAWTEIKKICDGLYRQLKKAKRRLSNQKLGRKERQNLSASLKTLAHELNKAVQVKRRSHKRWQEMRVQYLAAKSALDMMY